MSEHETMNPAEASRYFIGDDCLCWSFGDVIDAGINDRVLSFYGLLKGNPLASELFVRDIVPSYTALAVYFDPAETDVDALIYGIENLMESFGETSGTKPNNTKKTVVLPVVYDGEDLQRVAEIHELTVEEVVRKHTSVEYRVAMVGFKPYFPYLIGLDKDLVTARLDNPRTVVPAGSVGIGGAQTGVYPEDSPGGWNLLGRTDPELLKQIKPGDVVIMKKVDYL
jgi:KipI family sensor histidine kinase inhibitor